MSSRPIAVYATVMCRLLRRSASYFRRRERHIALIQAATVLRERCRGRRHSASRVTELLRAALDEFFILNDEPNSLDQIVQVDEAITRF
jgi:hypothetical protein